MWNVNNHLSVNLALVISAIFSIGRELELKRATSVFIEAEAFMEGVFVALFFCFASYTYNRKSVSLVTPQLIGDGLDPSHAGLILSCQNAAFAVSKFFAGVLSDRTNPRILFATGLLISGLATLFFSSSSSLSIFCALWFLNGLAQGCGWPSCAKIIRQVRIKLLIVLIV
ncbi:glucose-6-phosphate exchanger SLC37A4 [Trichonephila clavipes]|nr:glucose-6-phosphate exchanger SLC37A4 [Trichonephila clavipes]